MSSRIILKFTSAPAALTNVGRITTQPVKRQRCLHTTKVVTSVKPSDVVASRWSCSTSLITRQMQTRLSLTSSAAPKTISKDVKRLHSSVLTLEQAVSNQPTRDQLKHLFLCSAIPMVGFGFMDNVIMIQAGSYIDATLGATLGMSTLMAAALGQVVSDVSGVLFGGVVERSMLSLGLISGPSIAFTSAQRALPVVKNVSIAGAACGVILGCLLGASTLLIRESAEDKRESSQLISSSAFSTAQTMVQNNMMSKIVRAEVIPVSDVQAFANANLVHKLKNGIAVLEQSTSNNSETLYTPLVTSDGVILAVMICKKSAGEFFQDNELNMSELMAKQITVVLERM